MADLSSYGTLLKVSGSAIAGLVKITPPKSVKKAINSTNHSSNGFKTQISNGLLEVEDFKATFSMDSTVMTTLYGYHTSGSIVTYQIYFPNTKTLTFPALLTEFAPGGADAANPELLQIECTFAPTSGSIAFA